MKKTKGFTIIEALIAIIIIAAVSAVAFEFFFYCRSFVLDSNWYYRALNHARETMEESYFDSTLTPTVNPTNVPLPATAATDEFTDKFPGATRTIHVQGDRTDYQKIIVSVRWP
ncbi:prepilin-type N-terminal cleavage/methylation domain-containing protein [Candidatus Omnitrophota bacterium]